MPTATPETAAAAAILGEFGSAEKHPEHIAWMACHFSPYGIYKNVGTNRQTVLSDGSVYISTAGNKDITPDTGDFVHPKWILAIGLFAAAIAMFFYGLGKNNRKIFRIHRFI